MNINRWDTISVLDIAQVNAQLHSRLSQLLMTFDTTVLDGFAGDYDAKGQFGPWSITGGSDTDIYVTLPITSGTLTPKEGSGPATDISGMSVEVEVNLEWFPSTVSAGVSDLQFDLESVPPPGGTRERGGIYVKSVTDPNGTGFGGEVGSGIAAALVGNKDKITFVFAQIGVVDTRTATWLLPKKSVYSYHTPQGSSGGYLAILSVVTDRDISGLNANIDSGIIDPAYPLAFVVSSELFLEHAILPALPGAFPGTSAANFRYGGHQITLAKSFDMKSIKEGAIYYTPNVQSLIITIDGNALKNTASGACGLHLPNAYLDFSATSTNVLVFDAGTSTFSFRKDPNPSTHSSSHMPWYDYLISLGAVGAAIMAIVLAAVESGLGDSLSSSELAGSLSDLPGSGVQWDGLNQITIRQAALSDCFVLHADVA
jgi:hypothetical protein